MIGCPFCGAHPTFFYDTQDRNDPRFPSLPRVTVTCPQGHVKLRAVGGLTDSEDTMYRLGISIWEQRELPEDVIELVTAGRILYEHEMIVVAEVSCHAVAAEQVEAEDAFKFALEAFSSRVPWEDTPAEDDHMYRDITDNKITLNCTVRVSTTANDNLVARHGIVVGIGNLNGDNVVSVRIEHEDFVRELHPSSLQIVSIQITDR